MIRLSAFVVTFAVLLPAQGTVLDVLDGETLYDGGFLLTLGQSFERRDTLRTGSRRIADPAGAHEFERTTQLALQYGLRHDLQIGAAVGWRHTELESAAGDAAGDGFSDLELLLKYRFLRQDGRGFATNYAAIAAVSVPTGDDDQRSGGAELSPEFQPGSGSLDPLLGLAVTHEPGRWRFNAAASYRFRTDLDGDGDRLGDDVLVELAAGNRFWLEPYPGPFMRLDVIGRYYHEERARMDGRLANTGGERFTAGLNLAFRPRPSLDFQVFAEVPLHERVHGTQLARDWTAGIAIGYRF